MSGEGQAKDEKIWYRNYSDWSNVQGECSSRVERGQPAHAHSSWQEGNVGVVMTGARCLRSRSRVRAGGVSRLERTATGRPSTMHCDLAAPDGKAGDASQGQ